MVDELLLNFGVKFQCLYFYMRNFCHLIGLEQWYFSLMCGSRKYPDSHHGGNWKFQGGGGVRGPGNSRGEGGWTIKSLSRESISFRFRPEFEHCFLPTW